MRGSRSITGITFRLSWPLPHPDCRKLAELCGSFVVQRLLRCKSRTFLLFLPLILFCALRFCPQAYGAQPNVAYFAGGCYWCTEAVFQQALGVTSVVSGYMQKAETVQVTFDPARTSYEKLLGLFWRAHDPTEVDSQGPDTGKQYRSAIFYVDEQQRQRPRNRRHRRKDCTQNRSQLRLLEPVRFGLRLEISRTFVE